MKKQKYIRDILVKLEKAKEELEHISKRLDVMIAFANEEREHHKVYRLLSFLLSETASFNSSNASLNFPDAIVGYFIIGLQKFDFTLSLL